MHAQIVLFFCLSCVSASPNVVVIMADDLGRNDIGAFGTNQMRTRNIDALGFNGVLFDRHYTQQACTPSRSAFLTGKYPFRMGMQGMPADAGENREISHEFRTLPGELKKLGYATHLVGKWHLGSGHKRALPQNYGYDEHYGYWNGYVSLFGQQILSIELGFNGMDFHNGSEPVFADKHITTTQLLSQRSLEIIRDHPQNKPLFLVVSHLVGHTSLSNGTDTLMEVSNLTRTDQNYHEIEDKTRRMLAENIQEMDDTVGKLVEALEKKGMFENTILLFFSDNGAPTVGIHTNHGSNFPLRGMKMQPFEGSVRIPAVLYSPLLTNKGRVFRKLVHITDWVPTLYRAAGGDPSVFGKIDGIDQWKNIAGDLNQDQRQEIVVDINERVPNVAVIGECGRYKFVMGKMFQDDGYLGASEQDGQYDVDSIMNSTVNQVISNHGSTPSAEQILQLRDAVTMEDCRNVEKPPNCTNGCLFDLENDPCEGRNVMEEYPDIAFNLNRSLMIHALDMRMQQKQSVDPKSDPKYCCGTWFNWLDQDGCYCKRLERFWAQGSNQISTPNIDALGYNGVIFGNHYVQQSCTPSRAAFLTGNYPIRSGYQGIPIFPGENRTMSHNLPTLPKALKGLGYRTVILGKWHLGAATKASLPHNYGFDEFHGWWNGFVSYFDHTSETVDFKQRKVGVDLHENLDPNRDEAGNYITDYVTRKAVSTIQQHPPDTPLYLNINHNAGHTGAVIGDYLSILEVHDLNATNAKYAHIKDETRRLLAEVTERMDQSIGKVLEALSDTGMLNNSIVLFFSDNGAPTLGTYANSGSNWPLRGGKMSIWQGAVLSPTVLYSPLLKNKGRMYNDLVHITDWLPTLLSAAGGNPSSIGQLDGINQWTNIALDQQANKRKELLVNIDHVNSQTAYVGYNGRYKILKTKPHQYDYVGDDGRDGTYNLNEVLECAFSKAAVKLHPLETGKYLSLRKQATMKNCRKQDFVKNCESRWCLFDVRQDPCETADVAWLHPIVVKHLKTKVKAYDRLAVPPLNVPWDDNCDPARCDGYWFPWLDEDEPCSRQKSA